MKSDKFKKKQKTKKATQKIHKAWTVKADFWTNWSSRPEAKW